MYDDASLAYLKMQSAFSRCSKGTFPQETRQGYHLIQIKITVTQSVISTVTCYLLSTSLLFVVCIYIASYIFLLNFFNWMGKSQDCTRIFQYYCVS